MQLMCGNLWPHSYVSGWSSLCPHGPGPVPTPEVTSAVSGLFISCFIVDMTEKSQQNAVLAVNSAGEQAEKNFPQLKAGCEASEFGALSSSVVGGREGRKRK